MQQRGIVNKPTKKWNEIIKNAQSKEGRRQGAKNRTKKNSKLVDLNPTVSLNTLNINVLNLYLN